MPRYFMHLDPDGTDHADVTALKKAVVTNVRDVMGGQIKDTGVLDLRYRIDAENDAGEIV